MANSKSSYVEETDDGTVVIDSLDDFEILCSKCGETATYDSPDMFCDDHWAEWWVEGIFDGQSPDPVASSKLKHEVMKSIKLLQEDRHHNQH